MTESVPMKRILQELKLSNLSRHLNTKKLKFQIMSFSEEQVIRICDTAIRDRVKIKEKVRENHRGKLRN